MVAGRDLPQNAVNALDPNQKLCSLPQYQELAKKVTAEQVGGMLGLLPYIAVASAPVG